LRGYGRAVPGEKGWRSPLPGWWVDEANDRLLRRGVDKKTLARALSSRGRGVSEMMVLRALHPDPEKRVATIETLDEISDALGLPRPVVVAATYSDALELQRTVSFSAADAERIRITAAVDSENDLRPAGKPVDVGDDTTKGSGSVDAGRPQAAGHRPPKIRRAPRPR
jgi:hypothetical protein